MNVKQIQSPACELRLFESPAELAAAAAKDWLEFLQVLDLAGREPAVALSGGRIAQTFFDVAARLFGSHRELLSKAHFFWADERCVPPEHPESNYAMAAWHLFKPLRIPETRLHRMPGEIEPSLAAATAARGLAKWLGAEPGEVPVLDLVLLGMGEDGHVASLFPGESSEAMDSPDLCRAVTAVKPPPRRVTMSYGILSRADNVWVLISGAGKEEALKASLEAPDKTPLGRVLASRSRTCIYTDLSAASGFAG